MYRLSILMFAVSVLSACTDHGVSSEETADSKVIREINAAEMPGPTRSYALVGATLIDGNGGTPLENSCVIVRDGKIQWVGKQDQADFSDGVEVVQLSGATILPGLIDAHYHDENSDTLTSLYLRNGVTSLRDPGEWIESYDALRASGKVLPRLFLAGPHLDAYPPAYPLDSYIVKDAEEAGLSVDNLARQGASVIKVYYGLSIGMIREVCRRASVHGLPVTAHLEVTNAIDAINAGLTGIEHITSFGTCLLPMQEVEKYKQRVLADKNARRRGRFEVWSSIDLQHNPYVDSLVSFLRDRGTFISPTLAVFERRGDQGDSIEVNGFANMLAFVGMLNAGGAKIVVGSHSYVPYAELGFAFHREMELLNDAGLSTMQVIVAATMENARFFRIDDRLGSIEPGKVADLIVVAGKPLEDIRALRDVSRVMLNGVWVR